MSRSRPRFAIVTLVALALASATLAAPPFVRPAFAGPSESATEASEHFQRGVEFSKDGDFEAALVEFKRAYELSPNYRVLYNLGQTSRELRDYAGALRSFTQYLKEGGNEAPKHEKVEAWVAELKGKIATITIKTTVPGADVSIDDVSVGTTPLKDPVIVNAGHRKVSATLSGYSPLQKYIDLAGTDSKTLTLELSPLGTSNAGGNGVKTTVGDGENPPPPRKASPAPWIALAGTGAAAIATGILGGLALASKSEFDKALNTFPGNSQAIEAKRSKTRTFAAAADVLGGVTAAGAVVTVVLFATQPRSSAASKDSDPKKSSSKSPELGVGIGSLELRGSF